MTVDLIRMSLMGESLCVAEAVDVTGARSSSGDVPVSGVSPGLELNDDVSRCFPNAG